MIANWHEEKQSAYLYRVLAEAEQQGSNQRMFKALAAAAETQACLWENKLLSAGQAMPAFHPSRRARLVAWLIPLLGPRAIKPVLASMKVRGLSIYGGASLGAGHPMPTSVEQVGYRHSSIGGGGNLRAAVFGVSDGLVSNACLVLGVTGAISDSRVILLTGVAGLIAGAASMAAGEYVSVRSQRELYEYQIQLEREELEEYPEEEAEELALIYNARGLSLDQARATANEMMQDKDKALDTLAREELGLNPDDLGSPQGAAFASFAAFSFGALIPVLPFLYSGLSNPIVMTMALSLFSLFGIGALISLFTGKSILYSGLRMTLIGATAGTLTYLVGWLLGVSIR